MKTDKLFYHLFLNQQDLLTELLPEIPIGSEYDYTAPVIKAHEFRHDGVLMPKTPDLKVPIVFMEAQMQADSEFYGRYFAEVYLHLKQYPSAREWRGLLIFRSRRHDMGSEAPYQMHFQHQVHRLYLQDLQKQTGLSPNLALLQLLVLPKKQVAEAAQRLLQNATDKIVLNERLELIEAILVNRFPQLNLEAIQAMLNIITTNDLRHTRFYRDVFREGEAELILRLLARRCGTLSAPQKSRIMALPKEKLDALGDALLDFTDMADLEAWLKPLN
jgi:predicted transposase YdaD